MLKSHQAWHWEEKSWLLLTMNCRKGFREAICIVLRLKPFSHITLKFTGLFANWKSRLWKLDSPKQSSRCNSTIKIKLIYIANFIANKKGLATAKFASPFICLIVRSFQERETGLEPATLSLGSWCSANWAIPAFPFQALGLGSRLPGTANWAIPASDISDFPREISGIRSRKFQVQK